MPRAAGVDFIEENGGGAGARLRHPDAADRPVEALPENAAAASDAEECRQARLLAGFSRTRLAAFASITEATLAHFEKGEAVPPGAAAAIRRALEALGVDFIAENGAGAGVRLRKA